MKINKTSIHVSAELGQNISDAVVEAALEMYFKKKHRIVLTKFDGRRKDG